MNFNKIRQICRPTRVILGLALLAVAAVTLNPYFLLGALPLTAGMVNFCPLCTITNKCDI